MELRGALASAAVALVVAGGGIVVSAASAQAPVAVVTPLEVGRYSTVEAAVPMSDASTYLVTMRGLLVGQVRSNQTDAELIYSAKELCANEVAHGLTWTTLAQQVRSLGMSQPFYRAYVQAAVTAFCPASLTGLG